MNQNKREELIFFASIKILFHIFFVRSKTMKMVKRNEKNKAREKVNISSLKVDAGTSSMMKIFSLTYEKYFQLEIFFINKTET